MSTDGISTINRVRIWDSMVMVDGIIETIVETLVLVAISVIVVVLLLLIFWYRQKFVF